MFTREKILIVEDEILVAQQIEDELQGFGYEVVSQVSYGEDVSKEVKKYNPDLVLMDNVKRHSAGKLSVTVWTLVQEISQETVL